MWGSEEEKSWGFVVHNTEIMVLCLAASSPVVLSHSLSLRLAWPSAPPPPPPSLLPLLSHPHHDTSNPTHLRFPRQLKPHPLHSPSHICHAGEYVFPDPIPEVADVVSTFLQHPLFFSLSFPCYYYLFVFASSLALAQETEKFRRHLQNKLSKKDVFGDSLDDVLLICTQVIRSALHSWFQIFN